MRPVQTISRKPIPLWIGILRDYTPDCLNHDFETEDIVRAAWRHAEVGRNAQPYAFLGLRAWICNSGFHALAASIRARVLAWIAGLALAQLLCDR